MIRTRSTRLTQPVGRTELDANHPLAHYAVAAWAGHRANVDAMGNSMRWVGAGIEQRAGFDGIEQYQTGASSSLGFWVDKSIGQFGTDDFFIHVRMMRGVPAASSAFLGKGDTGAAEWMIGAETLANTLRFYGGAGGIVATAANAISAGVEYSIGVGRVSGVVSLYRDAMQIASDASASASLSDSVHHLTIGGADYDGTTFDNARNYVGGVSQVILLRGVGGNDIAGALHAQPWALFKPSERRVFVPVVSSSGPVYASATSASAFTVRVFASASQAGAWSVRAYVGAAGASAWSVRNHTAASRSAAASVRNFTSASASAAFSVQASGLVTASRSAAWTVRNAVASSAGAAFTVRNHASALQAGAWSVRSAVAATRSAAWSVKAYVYHTAGAAWSVDGDGGAVTPWPTGRADPQHQAVVPFFGVRAMVPAADVRAVVTFTGVRAIVQQDTP